MTKFLVTGGLLFFTCSHTMESPQSPLKQLSTECKGFYKDLEPVSLREQSDNIKSTLFEPTQALAQHYKESHRANIAALLHDAARQLTKAYRDAGCALPSDWGAAITHNPEILDLVKYHLAQAKGCISSARVISGEKLPYKENHDE